MTTNNRDDNFWADMADEMQRALHLRPLTEDEAALEYQQAPEVPISDEEIDASLAIAKSFVPKEASYDERAKRPAGYAELDQEVGEVIGLHRHEGETDPEVEEEMRRKRAEALREDEEQDDEDEPQS